MISTHEYIKTEIQEIADSCIKRWGEDKKTRNFSGKLGRFVKQLGDDSDLGNIFLELIKHYNYYSRTCVQEIMEDIDRQINYELKLDLKTTRYSRIQNSSKIDSSNYFLEEFKATNDIPNDICIDILIAKDKEFEEIKNIVFFDDIIGSGKTVSDFFEQNLQKFKKVNYYIFCIEMMYDSKEYLETFFKDNEIKCNLYPYNVQKKSFNIDILGESYLEKEKLVSEHEKKLWGGKSPNILGYKNSQAIISFFRNTPNNTLSSFWYKGSKWQGLFPRTNVNDWVIEKNEERNNNKNIKYNLAILERRAND